ncbi:MAG TPA: rRNA maturation RNase YbeY [Nitrospirae bacterium]|nr:endoribonuclease YbeY [bacterium BMS3Abin10]GBE38348.1 endoribonuclease YbeY [bacterium BMS3Bbin08]HDH00833.1 rRNA maturation RNase YbeY [Nitrospirota bacterium]HDK41331.1 rRNA maturation RNase YbeY [Nitrospirota bacterium]
MTILIKNQQRYKRLNRSRIEKTARKILALLEEPPVELSILFIDNKEMKQMNASFRGMIKTTDVLSFPQLESGDIKSNRQSRKGTWSQRDFTSSIVNRQYLLGDVVINVQKAASRANTPGSGLYDEIFRLLVHGVLHLLGYDHEKSRYGAAVMKKKEKELLSAIKKMG